MSPSMGGSLGVLNRSHGGGAMLIICSDYRPSGGASCPSSLHGRKSKTIRIHAIHKTVKATKSKLPK